MVKKVLILMVACLLSATAMLQASKRVVLGEMFTATSCGPCASANPELTAITYGHIKDLAVIRTHVWWPSNNDPFYLGRGPDTMENRKRRYYYFPGSAYVPHLIVDGDTLESQSYETRINNALAVSAPAVLQFTTTYDTTARTGTINWFVEATESIGYGKLYIRSAVTESDKYYLGTNGDPWHNEILRDFVPDTQGVSVNLSSIGDSAYGQIAYSIDPTWVAKNCQLVVFLQTDSIVQPYRKRPVLQAAKDYLGSKLVQTNISASTGSKEPFLALPGDSVELTVSLQNQGGAGINAACVIATSSPYLNIVNDTWTIGPISLGDTTNNAASPFIVAIDPTTPNGHRALITLTKSIDNAVTGFQNVKVDTAWIIVGTSTQLFHDDFESGYGNWTRGGSGGVNWDTTSLQSHSPIYCVTDSRTGNYSNNVNRYIQLTNSLNLTPYQTALLSWWERYSTESGWDYCYPEYSLNGTTWYTLIPQYSGSNTTWSKRTVDITDFCSSGSTFRIRFRLTSDGSVVDDGWYVDDVSIDVYENTGVTGGPSQVLPVRTSLAPVRPNPSSGPVRISYQLAAATKVTLGIYDVAGRLVRTLASGQQGAGQHQLTWDGLDNSGEKAANGVYIYRLTAGDYTASRKLTVVR